MRLFQNELDYLCKENRLAAGRSVRKRMRHSHLPASMECLCA